MNSCTQILIGYLTNLELWGALCGLVGTIFLFLFGLPPKIDPDGAEYFVTGNTDQNEKNKYEKYKNFSYLGLFFIALSFLIQIIVITQK